MSKKVYILVGLPGSGKSSAGLFFQKLNIPVVRMGILTEKNLKKENLSDSEINEKKVREDLRQKFGADIYAREVLGKTKKLQLENEFVVIEGMRSMEEWIFFQENLENPEIIFLDSDLTKRLKRLRIRGKRPLTAKEANVREEYEVKKLKIRSLKKLAAKIIKNNSDIKDFYSKLEKIIQK